MGPLSCDDELVEHAEIISVQQVLKVFDYQRTLCCSQLNVTLIWNSTHLSETVVSCFIMKKQGIQAQYDCFNGC